MGLFKKIGNFFKKVGKAIAKCAPEVFDRVEKTGGKIWSVVKTYGGKIISGIKTILPKVLPFLKVIAPYALAIIVGAFLLNELFNKDKSQNQTNVGNMQKNTTNPFDLTSLFSFSNQSGNIFAGFNMQQQTTPASVWNQPVQPQNYYRPAIVNNINITNFRMNIFNN